MSERLQSTCVCWGGIIGFPTKSYPQANGLPRHDQPRSSATWQMMHQYPYRVQTDFSVQKTAQNRPVSKKIHHQQGRHIHAHLSPATRSFVTIRIMKPVCDPLLSVEFGLGLCLSAPLHVTPCPSTRYRTEDIVRTRSFTQLWRLQSSEPSTTSSNNKTNNTFGETSSSAHWMCHFVIRLCFSFLEKKTLY